MSDVKKKFYNLFWQNQSCQNLFLLSKEELLETSTIGDGENAFVYTTNRIIISNARNEDSDIFDTIKIRNENQNIFFDNSLETKIEYFKPLIEEFFNKRFKKSIEKVIEDFDKKGFRLLFSILIKISDPSKMEANLVHLLQQYGFVGKNLNSFNEIEEYYKKLLFPGKNNELINEQTMITFFEGIKFVKELYVNHSYKKLYSTNQILINTLNSEDSFESRIKLFHLLYDSQIILPSSQDAFIECPHCDTGTYRGVFQLKLNPKKLQDLKCPSCSKELTYFVPYELHQDIYAIVKQKDGLLQDALCNILQKNHHKPQTNVLYLNDIEVDCQFTSGGETFLIETKMYKISTTREKLKSKIREHFYKLLNDIRRLKVLPLFANTIMKPILLVNIIDKELLQEMIKELHINEETKAIKLININQLTFTDQE